MINKKLNALNVNRFILNDKLRESFELYKKRAVSSVKMDEFGFVTSLVSDKREYITEVLIKDDLLIEYHCDCGSFECCSHVGALLYYLSNEGVNISSYSNTNHLLMDKANSIVDKFSEAESKELLKELLRYNRNLSYVKNKYKDNFLSDEVENYEYHLDELFSLFVVNGRVISQKEDLFLEKLSKLIGLASDLIVADRFDEGYRFYKKIKKSFQNFDILSLNDYFQNKYYNSYVKFYEKILFNILVRKDKQYSDIVKLVDVDLHTMYRYFTANSETDPSKAALLMEFIKDLAKYLSDTDPDFSNSYDYYELHYYYLEFFYRVDQKSALAASEKYIENYKIRMLVVKHHVKDGDIEIAVRLLNEGINSHFHKEFLKPLAQIYQRYDYQKYPEFLYRCFFELDKYNKVYYDLLKSSMSFNVEKLLSRFDTTNGYPKAYFDILIDNKMYDRLITCLASVENFDELVYYNKYLILDYNKELVNLYEMLILSEIKRGVDSDTINRHLDYFSKLPNSEEIYKRLIEELN